MYITVMHNQLILNSHTKNSDEQKSSEREKVLFISEENLKFLYDLNVVFAIYQVLWELI